MQGRERDLKRDPQQMEEEGEEVTTDSRGTYFALGVSP